MKRTTLKTAAIISAAIMMLTGYSCMDRNIMLRGSQLHSLIPIHLSLN